METEGDELTPVKKQVKYGSTYSLEWLSRIEKKIPSAQMLQVNVFMHRLKQIYKDTPDSFREVTFFIVDNKGVKTLKELFETFKNEIKVNMSDYLLEKFLSENTSALKYLGIPGQIGEDISNQVGHLLNFPKGKAAEAEAKREFGELADTKNNFMDLESLLSKETSGRIDPPHRGCFNDELLVPTLQGNRRIEIPLEKRPSKTVPAVKIEDLVRKPDEVEVKMTCRKSNTIALPANYEIVAVVGTEPLEIIEPDENHPLLTFSRKPLKKNLHIVIKKRAAPLKVNPDFQKPNQKEMNALKESFPVPKEVSTRPPKNEHMALQTVKEIFEREFVYVCDPRLGEFMTRNKNDLATIMDGLKVGHCSLQAWAAAAYFRQLGFNAIVTAAEYTSDDGTGFAKAGHARVALIHSDGSTTFFDPTNFSPSVKGYAISSVPDEKFDQLQKDYDKAKSKEEKKKVLNEFRKTHIDSCPRENLEQNQANDYSGRAEQPQKEPAKYFEDETYNGKLQEIVPENNLWTRLFDDPINARLTEEEIIKLNKWVDECAWHGLPMYRKEAENPQAGVIELLINQSLEQQKHPFGGKSYFTLRVEQLLIEKKLKRSNRWAWEDIDRLMGRASQCGFDGPLSFESDIYELRNLKIWDQMGHLPPRPYNGNLDVLRLLYVKMLILYFGDNKDSESFRGLMNQKYWMENVEKSSSRFEGRNVEELNARNDALYEGTHPSQKEYLKALKADFHQLALFLLPYLKSESTRGEITDPKKRKAVLFAAAKEYGTKTLENRFIFKEDDKDYALQQFSSFLTKLPVKSEMGSLESAQKELVEYIPGVHDAKDIDRQASAKSEKLMVRVTKMPKEVKKLHVFFDAYEVKPLSHPVLDLYGRFRIALETLARYSRITKTKVYVTSSNVDDYLEVDPNWTAGELNLMAMWFCEGVHYDTENPSNIKTAKGMPKNFLFLSNSEGSINAMRHELRGTRVTAKKFSEVGLDIFPRFREKTPEELEKELMEKLETSYDEMAATLKEFGFTQTPPSKSQVMDAIKHLDPDKLKEIAKFGKPTVIITPPGDFASKVKAIDDSERIRDRYARTIKGEWNPEVDGNTSLNPPDEHNPTWGVASKKMVVTVVDGFDHMPHPPFDNENSSVVEIMSKYEEEFEKRKLNMMDCQEGAMLMMQSLECGQPVDDYYRGNPVDDFEFERTKTITYCSRKHLAKGSPVPNIKWDSRNCMVDFNHTELDDGVEHTDLRCRPSVKVLEVKIGHKK